MKNFIVIFLFTFLRDGVFGADEMKKEVTEGDSLTLPTALTETQSSDQILWLYGPEKNIIASINRGISNTDDDERFKGNLELDKQTGSLTIKNIRIINAGLYQLDINRKPSWKFSVTVYAQLPTPEIDSPQCAQTPAGSSSLKCVFQCSVQTSDQATLSWYKGNSLVSRKISNICSRISLPLEVNYEDKNPYSCVVNNPISNQTQHLDINQLCQPCPAVPDPGLSSGAVAGIVVLLLLLFAVAAAAGVIYYRRMFELEKNKKMMISVTEGDSVTLGPDTKIKKDDCILFYFGDESTLTGIAEIKNKTQEMLPSDYAANERFRDRLKLDNQTGSLTITNITTDHAGLYKLEIYSSNGGVSEKTFSVTVKDKVDKKLLEEKDSVTLNPDTEIQKDDLILWMFGAEDSLIGQIRGQNGEIIKYDDVNVKFRGRLELNNQTGSLTILNTTADHNGLYKLLIINSRGTSYKKFKVLKQVKYETVMEGRSVTLNTDAEIQSDDQIEWRFGDENSLIAEFIGETGKTTIYDDVPNRRFKKKLYLEEKTGSLTITNIKTTCAGVYNLKITSSSKGNTIKTFIVIVRARTRSLVRLNENPENESIVEMMLLNHPYEN